MLERSSLRAVTANGLSFSYLELGSGPLVLCLHGFPDTPHTWREVQPQLAKAGYRTVAPYLRGYPPTQAPPDSDYSSRQLGGDVVALIHALGEEQAYVIGHDWGAFAAYAAAALEPRRVLGLIIVAIPHPGSLRPGLASLWKSSHFLTYQLRGRSRERLRRNGFAEVDAIYRRWSPRWRPSEAELAPVKEALAAPGGVDGALGYYWSFRADAFGRALATWRRQFQSPTTVPTLAFFGETDGALDQSGLERTRACFSNSYEMVRVPAAGHFVHREAAALFVERTLAFLLSHQGSARSPTEKP